jgi:glycerate 2-kinase
VRQATRAAAFPGPHERLGVRTDQAAAGQRDPAASQPGPAPVSNASQPGLAPVSNASQLLDHGNPGLRQVVLEVAAAGLRAADPALATERLVQVQDGYLRAGGRCFDLNAARSVVLLGAGKASLPIAAVLERKLGDRITGGLVVRRRGQDARLRRIEVIDADHPVPSAASLDAARRLVAVAGRLGPGDLVITAFTGGSSALACLPPDGVPFAAKQQLHSLLLDSGASIAEINTVRKHVSALKGGRLAGRADGAAILNLTVSDVVGNAVDLLCDPTVPDTSAPAAAVTVLERYGLWRAVAPEVRRHLLSPEAESPSLRDADITTVVLVRGSDVIGVMAERTRALGWQPVILGSAIEGEAASLGRFLGALAAESSRRGRPFAPGSVLLAAGGEATVSLRPPGAGRGGVGRGGPNQEAALGFARGLGPGLTAVAGVFLDSDGSDGGTDAAGGCVDSGTAARADDLLLHLDDAITCHDSSGALGRLGDLVTTGPTGTNVSDLWVVAIDAAQRGPHRGPGRPAMTASNDGSAPRGRLEEIDRSVIASLTLYGAPHLNLVETSGPNETTCGCRVVTRWRAAAARPPRPARARLSPRRRTA